jgi:hypothetical protein
LELYWCIVVAAASNMENEARYQVLRNLLLIELARRGGSVLASALTNGHALLGITKRLDRIDVFAEDMKRLASTGTLFLPFDPSLRIDSVEAARIKVMASNARPVRVPCSCTRVNQDGQPVLSDTQSLQTASRREDPAPHGPADLTRATEAATEPAPSPKASLAESAAVRKAFFFKPEDLRKD